MAVPDKLISAKQSSILGEDYPWDNASLELPPLSAL